MKNKGLWLWVFSLLAVVSFGPMSDAQSQDIFREMDQVKKDVSALRNEVNELKDQINGLRQAILKSVASQDQSASGQAPPKEKAAKKQEMSVHEEQLTDSICQTVGKFFVEVDSALAMSDSSAADEKMKKAFHRMNSTLQHYSSLHRVSKLLGIYEGLAWDTYVAVELSGSVQGNEQFIKTINKHKQKYNETCRKR